MDSSAEARRMDLFGLFTNVIATNVSVSSFTLVLGRPDLGTLLTEPVLSICS